MHFIHMYASVWVAPEKGSAPQRLQVSGNIFYSIFICPQRPVFAPFFSSFPLFRFTIFFHHIFAAKGGAQGESVAKTNSPQTKWVCGAW